MNINIYSPYGSYQLGGEWDRQELRFVLDFTLSLFYHENTPVYGEKRCLSTTCMDWSSFVSFCIPDRRIPFLFRFVEKEFVTKKK